MSEPVLYSIGHGRRSETDFLHLLQQYHIRYLADVRSVPYSRFNPQYNRERLDAFLAGHGIRYVYMGDVLGGRPKDPACYDSEGNLDRSLVMQQPAFGQGIQRLVTASRKNIGLAFMCSETDPARCHRTHLVGRALAAAGITLRHIDQEGQIKSQQEALSGTVKKKKRSAGPNKNGNLPLPDDL